MAGHTKICVTVILSLLTLNDSLRISPVVNTLPYYQNSFSSSSCRRNVQISMSNFETELDLKPSNDAYFEELKEKEIRKIRRIQEINDMCQKTSKMSSFALMKQAQFADKLMNVNFVLQASKGSEPTKEEWAEACELPPLGFSRYISTGFTAKTQIIERNLGLVKKSIRNYITNGGDTGDLTVAELHQEGIFGLAGATETFDPAQTKGTFSNYATYWIRTAIRLAVAKKNAIIRFPTQTVKDLDAILQARPHLITKLGGPPSDRQIARHLNWSIEKMQYYSIYLTGSTLDDLSNILAQRSETEEKLFKAVV